MLYQAVAGCDLKASLKPKEEYRPFPTYGERAAWAALPEEIKSYYAGAARGLSGKELTPPLRAARYMDFMRDGNRGRYEGVYFARRDNLVALTLAECVAGNGALIDDIIDIVWALCEETTWVVPAHNNHSGAPRSLPDIEAPVYIDLFAAETGSALAWAYYFLGDEMAKRSPLVKRRIEIEIKRRILDPYLNDDSFGWKGLEHDQPVNNWNPWINSNVLAAFLIMEPCPERRAEGALRTAKSTQRFLDFYFPDGGCDEGPGYFGVAGASLFDYLEEICYATGGAVNIYGDPLIANIAKYIYRVHVGGDFYVNFADAPPHVRVSTGLLIRVGKAIGDPDLVNFCQYMENNGRADKPYAKHFGTLYRLMSSVFSYAPASAAPYVAPRDHMFEGIQVMTARQEANSEEGIFVAFKGGHNAESHNHNDIGSFILYKDGKPIVLDAGVETYTRKTFSDRRYEIWTMRSDYHNLPDINGFTQFPGKEAKASDVKYGVNGGVTEMSLDIAGAYPAEANVKSYRRALRFDRAAKTVTVSDEYELSKAEKPIVAHIMSFNEPKPIAPGKISLDGLTLAYDAGEFEAAVEPIALSDEKIRHDWGKDEVFRVLLTAKQTRERGAYTLVFA